MDNPGLPDRRSRLPVVGENRYFRDATLILALGDWNFGNHGRYGLHERNLWHVHRRQAEEQIIAVGADGPCPAFHNEVGLLALIAKFASIAQQILPQRADEVVLIDHIGDFRIVKKHALAGERVYIHILHGTVNGIGNKKLLGGRAVGIGRARRSAAGKRQRRRGEHGGDNGT